MAQKVRFSHSGDLRIPEHGVDRRERPRRLPQQPVRLHRLHKQRPIYIPGAVANPERPTTQGREQELQLDIQPRTVVWAARLGRLRPHHVIERRQPCRKKTGRVCECRLCLSRASLGKTTTISDAYKT